MAMVVTKKFFAFAVAFAATLSFIRPAWAATQTVTLSVPTMVCGPCEISIRQALARIDGVEIVDVRLTMQDVKVTFDDAKTSVEALENALKSAGYPASVTQ